MSETVSTFDTIADMVAAGGAKDNSETLRRTWGILEDIVQKIRGRFHLEAHPNSEKYRNYASPDGKFRGQMNTYSGPEMDWLLHAWCGNPETGFTNQHLNVWLGPQSMVPHIGIVFGTVPDLFAFQDFPPRVDLWSNPSYVEKYYGGSIIKRDHKTRSYVSVGFDNLEPANKAWLDLRQDKRLRSFVSQDPYMRICTTPLTVCVSSEGADEEVIGVLEKNAHSMIDRWLRWVDECPPVPEEQRPALLARDRRMRIETTRRDAANDFAETMFGKEMAWDLIETMCGANRDKFE